MKLTLGGLALGVLFAIALVASAADAPDPVIGTWKLNVAKSSGANVPRSETRTYAAADGGVALTWKRVSADGKEMTARSTFKYDGKDYPVTGSPDFDTLNVTRLAPNTVSGKQKRAGKIVGTTTRSVSRDGKTLTLASRMTSGTGGTSSTTLVYDRQ